jgi:hypothetical protein
MKNAIYIFVSVVLSMNTFAQSPFTPNGGGVLV